MKRNPIEAVMAIAVLAVAAAFLILSYNSIESQPRGRRVMSASFDQIEGLKLGDSVRLAGAKVGHVSAFSLSDQQRAQVWFEVAEDIPIYHDAFAAIYSRDLWGGKYIALDPGGIGEPLPPNGIISVTQGSILLDELLGRIVDLAQHNRK